MTNPLYPSEPKNDDHQPRGNHGGFVLPRKDYNVAPPSRGDNAAADIIRDKLAKIYASEPDPLKEEKQAEAAPKRTKHQDFIYQLNHSGKDLAQIQTDWHNYYIALDEADKQQVWQEFYASNERAKQTKHQLQAANPTETERLAAIRNQLAAHHQASKEHHVEDRRSAQQVQRDIRKAAKQPPSRARQHLHSLGFGLATGAIAVFILLFTFFNEVIVWPFIQPARTSAETPLIVSSDTVAATPNPEVIIPKINVEIPLQFDVNTTDESVIENQLESGVVHYPTTALPGQNGNSSYFGHSSNNLFNKGKYKFAFVYLHRLVPGDLFYLTKDSKVYAYKVFSKTIVKPTEVSVLNPIAGHPATATLITCDPPGTSLNRLIVVGDQISPDPNSNGASTTGGGQLASSSPELVGNGRTLGGRIIGSTVGKVVIGVVAVIVLVGAFRLLNRPKRR